MVRPLLIRSAAHPYHISSRCNAKEFFPLPMEVVWLIMINSLRSANTELGLAIHAFVLMGNHFHLLCQTPHSNLDEIMHFLRQRTSLIINQKADRSEPLWEDRYRWTLIASQTHYFQVYRYIFQNPLRAGLIQRVEDYPFSTLNGELPFPLHSFVPMSFGGIEGEIVWLNQRFEEEDNKLIQKGLKKAQFDINRKHIKTFNKLSGPA